MPKLLSIAEFKAKRGSAEEGLSLTGPHLRAARALCGLEPGDLAAACGVSTETIERLETSRCEAEADFDALEAMVDAFRRRGVEFDLDGPADER